VHIEDSPAKTLFTLTTTGRMVRIPKEMEMALSGTGELQPGSSDAILPYFTIRLAQSVAMKLEMAQSEEQFVLKAETIAQL
jgi:hypothetical protein